MKSTLLALVFALPALAQADIIKCQFTEPFLDTSYSMTQSTITVHDPIAKKKQVIKNVSFQIMGPGQFELWDKNKNVLQRLDLNGKGSDGMSDRVFPYEVQWTAKGLWGGCSSNFLQATNQ